MHKAKGNMYSFITHTWNPIQGQCPHECSYCYAIATRNRFRQKPELYLNDKTLIENLGKDRFIFVGSSNDMFAKGVDVWWVYQIFEQCRLYPNNKYFFQSKNPERFYKFSNMFPSHTTFCTTLESNRDYDIYSNETRPPKIKDRADWMSSIMMKYFPTMITIEPILDFDLDVFSKMLIDIKPMQINIGADSGRNKLPAPSPEKVQALINELKAAGMKVHLKKNLNRIIGGLNGN